MGTSFDLDEANLHWGRGVLWIVAAGDEVEAAVFALHTFGTPASRLLVSLDSLHSDLFNLVIAHQWGDIGRGAVGVGKHPGASKVIDLTNGAMALLG